MSAGKAEDSIGNIKPLTPWTPIIPGSLRARMEERKRIHDFHARQKIGQPPIPGPLDTPDKLQAYLNSCPPDLKDLDLRSRHINSLVGIRFPPGLKSLLLNFNNISEIIKPTQHGSGVVFPPGLETLELHDNQIERLKGVQFPPSLKILTLNNNKIRSLQEVQFPPRLEELDLYDNQIESLQNIDFPQSLEELTLNGNKIIHLTGVKFPPNLTEFDISDNPLDDIASMIHPNKTVIEHLKREYSPLYFRDLYYVHKQLKMNEKSELKTVKQSEQTTLKKVSDFNQLSMQNQLRGITSFLREGMEARAQQHAEQLTRESEELGGRSTIEVRLPNGIKYPVPLNTANSVQSVLDYMNEHYYISSLVPNCGVTHLYKSDIKEKDPLNPTSTLADNSVQKGSRLHARCVLPLNPSSGGNRRKRIQTRKTKITKRSKRSKISKKWSLKYKKSINCRRPRGFSQRQYCKYGRK
jgi:Leucine-rich repeat (LRR) protein